MEKRLYKFALSTLLIAGLILVNIPRIHAQFSQVYGNSSNNFFNRLIPDGQDFYVLGRDGGKATVSRINSAGVLSWTRVLDMPSRLTDGMVLAGSGNMIVVGATTPVDSSNHSILGEITRQGVFNCLKTLDVPGAEALTRMDRNANGTFSVVGTQTLPGFTQDVFVLNVSPGCLINSKKVISSPGVDNFANDIKVLCNGDFLVAGDYDGRAVMFEFSPTGQYVTGSHNPFNYTYNDIANTSNCDILVVANSLVSAPPIIQRFDADWLPLWEASIVGLQTLNKVIEDGNGNILVTARALIGGVTRSVILKIDDSSGSPILSWGGARYIENSESSFVGGSVALPISGGIAIIDGRDGNPNGFGMPDAFMAYTDDDLTSDCTRDLVLDVVIESTLFEGPIIEIFNYDVPPETMVTYSSVDWEQREACSGNPNPDSCVCATPEFNLFQNGMEYALDCQPHQIPVPVVGCPTGTVSIGGFFGCIDPITGEPCATETAVTYILTGPNGGTPIDGGTTTNYTQFLFPPSYFQANGTYTLTLSTLCPGQQDSCVCKLDWIVECNSGEEMNLSCGMAVATCFSGYDRVANTVIPNAPVIALFDVRDPITPAYPLGSNWAAPKQMFVQGDAVNCGQVFGLAIDNNGNIITTSSTIYGDHINTPGLVWTSDGPGAIWRFYFAAGSWHKELFTILPNGGSGLGNITYDKMHDQFFVTNFHDGLIYRIKNTPVNTQASVASTYQHTGGVSIPTSPYSDFVPLGKRIWGIGYNHNDFPNGRVYFARWNEDKGRNSAAVFNEIRSIGLGPTGDFLSSSFETHERQLTSWNGQSYSNPVSDIEFSENGNMLVGEKVMMADVGNAKTVSGNYAHEARIFQYTGVSTIWTDAQPLSKIFIGNVNSYDNSAGGVDYGYKDMDSSGQLIGCDDLVWGSGDALMYNGQNDFNNSTDYVYGIAGMPASGNAPSGPLWVESTSIYVDLDGSLANIEKLQIGDVDIYNCPCPASPDIPCDSLMVMYENVTMPQDSCCRWTVDLKNNTGLSNISHATFHILTPSVIFNEFQTFGGFLVDNTSSLNPDTDILVYHQGGSIPAGFHSDVVNFCLGGINASTPVPQQIEVTWYQQLGPDHFVAVCMDTINVQCPVMDSTSMGCWSLVDSQVDCNMDNMTYTVQIKVKNETQNETFDYLVFYNFTPGNFGWNPTVVQIPGGLAPQGTSVWLTFTVNPYSYSPIPQVICFNISPINIDGDFCCTEPKNVCITLPPCCDACEDSNIILTQVGGNPTNPNDCCYEVGINNLCAWNYFSRIEAEILTGGITFLNHADLNTNWHTIYSNPKELHWANSFGSFPKGTYNPLFNFCLNNVMNIPQEIEIRWIALDANGNEFVACIDTIETFCPPPVMDTCMLVTPYEVICNGDGTYDFSMTVYNVSNPQHDATIVSLLPVAPTTSLDYMPQTFGPLAAGTGASYNLTLKGNPGDVIKFYVRFQELIFPPPMEDNWCCYQKDTICITLPPCDTCYCKDPSFTNLFLRGPGGPSIPIQCETSYENIGCPDPGYGFNLTGFFDCAGDSCFSQPEVYWNLVGPGGSSIGFGSAPGPYFGINLLPAYFLQPGIYTMELSGFCNFDTCSCEFQFIVECPNQCPCDISDLQADVNQGFNYVVLPASCQACFTPNALSDCDSVKWYVTNPNGTPIGLSTGNYTFCHTFTGSGTYTVYMEVTRRRADGSICETFRKSQIVKIYCGGLPQCDDHSFDNPTFSEGAVAGNLGDGGASNGWTSLLGRPMVVEGSPGSLDGWTMNLWGNLDTASVLTSINAMCLKKDTGTFMLRYECWNCPVDYVKIRMHIHTDDHFKLNECDSTNCFDIATFSPTIMGSNEWVDLQIPYDIRNWNQNDTCSEGQGILVKPIIYVTNALSSEQGGESTYTKLQLDNVCINGLIIAVTEPSKEDIFHIFPNPTSGDISIEFPSPASSNMKMRVVGIEGQLLMEKGVDVGISLQTIETEVLPKGMYFLQILSNGQVMAVNKFVKM